MKYDDLIRLLGDQTYFDMASVAQLSGERRQNIRVQLHRWCGNGKLVRLRRGMYAFAGEYRKRELNHAELANALYRPSYISTHWALGFFGLIPEMVFMYTSVTSRTTKRFENVLGAFSYCHIKPSAFFGYHPVQINGRKVLIADPEKALLDLWYFGTGEWGDDRMAEMRFQNHELIDSVKLGEYASRLNSPRVSRALSVWERFVEDDRKGTVEL